MGFPAFAVMMAFASLSAPFVSSTVYAAPVSLLQTRMKKDRGSAAKEAKVELPTAAPPQASLSEIASTLHALDANHDKRIDPGEVVAFASALGLDAKSITNEFSGLDENGDGTLDEAEIAQALRTPDSPTPSNSAQSFQQSESSQMVADENPKQHVQNEAQDSVDREIDPKVAVAEEAALTAAAREVVQQTAAVSPPAIHPASPQALSATEVLATNPAVTAPTQNQQQPQEQDQKHTVLSKGTQAAQAASNSVDSTFQQDTSKIPATLIATSAQQDVAQNAANLVATQLALQAAQNAEARRLDQEAVQFRAHANAVARTALQEAIEAGERAAMAESQKMVHLLETLELGALTAESQAASLHAKADAEMKQANDYSSIASIALGDYSRKAGVSPDSTAKVAQSGLAGKGAAQATAA